MGLAVCAIAPATAAASPPMQSPPQDVAPQSLAALNQVDRGPQSTKATPNPGPPQWPANPRAVAGVPRVSHPSTSAQPSNDDGVDTSVLIALGGGAALLLAGGLGVAGRKRLHTGRRSQLA
jgi:hypothetical protein